MTRVRGRARPRCTHNQRKLGVADNPARGKAHGRNDRERTVRISPSRLAKRTARGSEAQKPDRQHVPVDRLSDLLFPQQAVRSPRPIPSGQRARTANGKWARTSRNAREDATTERVVLAVASSRGNDPRVHPQTGANLRRAQPHERRRAERGKNLTARPGRGGRGDKGSGTSRARNGRDE